MTIQAHAIDLDRGSAYIQQAQAQVAEIASPRLVITRWKDLKGQSKEELVFDSPTQLLEWFKTRPPVVVKNEAPLVKFTTFGNKRSDKNCLRTNDNVLYLIGVEGDLDNGKLSFDRVVELLERHNIKAIVLTSHSHTDQHPKLRIFCLFSRPLDKSERRLWTAVLNGILEGNLAAESFTLSQAYFIGGRPGGGYRCEATFGDAEEGFYLDELPELIEFADFGESKPESPEFHPFSPEPDEDLSEIERLRRKEIAREKLELAARKIRESQPGKQHDTRRDMAHLVGGYMYCDLDREEVLSVLENAVQDSGAKNIRAAMKTVEDGLDHGIVRPLPTDPHHPAWEHLPRKLQTGSSTNNEQGRFAKRFIAGEELFKRFLASMDESWRIEGILPSSAQLIQIFGPPDRYKSFIALDMALSVAAGIPYHGHPVDPCNVLYIAAEGAAGVLKRVMTWRVHHGIGQLNNFTILPLPCILDSEDDVRAFIKDIATLPQKPCLIVVDTLARSMLGDENSTKDMNRVVYACGRITESIGAQVLLVHHTGKDVSKGSRGALSLEGATDVQFEVKGNGTLSAAMHCKRMKDYEKTPPLSFNMEIVDTGYVSRNGDAVTSLVPVLDPIASQESTKPHRPRVTGAALIALDSLRGLCRAKPRAHIDEWRDAAYDNGITGSAEIRAKQKAFARAFKKLREDAIVSCDGDYYWPAWRHFPPDQETVAV
jgi:hypothetical protein